MKYEKLALEQYRELTKLYKAVKQDWDKTKAIFITYTGAGVSADVDVTADALVLNTPAHTPVKTIDLTAEATNTLAEVVSAINTFATGWTAVLGDQFDGDENAADLTVVADVNVKTTGAWLVNDTNLQIKITVPAVATDKQVAFTIALGKSTYAGGTSVFRVYNGTTLAWEESAGATTVQATCSLPVLSIDLGNQLIVKIKNSTGMTAGSLSIGYEEKYAAPYTA